MLSKETICSTSDERKPFKLNLPKYKVDMWKCIHCPVSIHWKEQMGLDVVPTGQNYNYKLQL